MNRRKKKGLFFLFGPIVLIVLVTILYAVVNVAFVSLASSEFDSLATVVNFILGLLGFISILGVMVGAPLGIYFLASSDSSSSKKKEPTHSKVEYSPLKKIGRLALVSQIVFLCLALLLIFADFHQLSLLTTLSHGESVSPEQATSADSVRGLIVGFHSLVWLFAFIVFLIWFSKAYKNLIVLHEKQKTTVEWAVADFFIPVVNFFEPYNRMKEIWLGTFGEKAKRHLLIFWWISFLSASLISRFGTEFGKLATQLDDLISVMEAIFVGDVAFAFTAVLTILIVRKVSRAQDDRVSSSKK